MVWRRVVGGRRYLNWVWFRISGTAFDATAFPNIGRHDHDMQQRPTVRRTLARHAAAATLLDERGLAIRFDDPAAIAAIAGQGAMRS